MDWASKTVEHSQRLDVRQWHREGLLIPGQTFTCLWRDGEGEETGRLEVEVLGDAVALRDLLSTSTEPFPSDPTPVALTWTPCYFGAYRPWFRCPGAENSESCGKRVAILCRPHQGKAFACRSCHGLVYSSQYEGRAMRSFRRQLRYRTGENFPSKPPGMHWLTYERLRSEVGEATSAPRSSESIVSGR